MHSVRPAAGSTQAYIIPTSSGKENQYFKDFDSAAQNYDEDEEDYEIPYDDNHRPLSTLDIEQLLPKVKPPNNRQILLPDDSPNGSPERGRSRHRQSRDIGIAYGPPSPPRDQPYQSSFLNQKINQLPIQQPPKQINYQPQPQTVLQPAFRPHPAQNSFAPQPVQRKAVPAKQAPATMSRLDDSSSDESSVFDEPAYENPDDAYTDPTQLGNSRVASAVNDDAQGYDLKPPPPSNLLENIEYLSERLYSADHLKLILKDPTTHSRFLNFLLKYRPGSRRAFQEYAAVQKAISAVDYANAIAESLGGTGVVAARADEEFEHISRKSVDDLVDNALPGYVTHRLVQIVTEVLVKEITGQNTPIMRELVNGLAEVYCLTDPSLPDNPIVYASEEFYRCTQYGKNYVIGRNCRFLQGPKTANASVQRLVDALGEGQEICETILNYRRDGSPFMNLLMIAPLYDNKGAVRYFIGAQVDVNGLIEGGRGLDSFEKLLREDRGNERYGGRIMGKSPEQALGELAGLWDEDDLESINSRGATRGVTTRGSQAGGSGTSTPVKKRVPTTQRRFVGMDDPTDKGLWPAPHLGPSGRLPGVFQNYLLIRPYPSLRITFTSPALRIPGLLQSKFLDRIGGPARIRDQILDALSSGVGVTAKVTWLPQPQQEREGSNHGGSYREHDDEGRQRWIHCTPLLGSDEKVGVWMVVMVESETVTGSLNAQRDRGQSQTQTPNQSNIYSPSTARNIPSRDGIQRALEANRQQAQSPQLQQHQQPINYPSGRRPSHSATQYPYPRGRQQSHASNASGTADRYHSHHQQTGSGSSHAASRTAKSPPPATSSANQAPPPLPTNVSTSQKASEGNEGSFSPKQFPYELRPINPAYGASTVVSHEKQKGERAPSSRGGTVRNGLVHGSVEGESHGGNGGRGESKEVRARKLAERATAGEGSFREF